MSLDPLNPIGIKSIDHLEFCTNSLSTPTRSLFHRLGFTKSHELRGHNKEVFTQGQIRFLLNANQSENEHAQKYYKLHGEGVSKISFLVEDVEMALETAVKRGACEVQNVKIEEDCCGTYKTAVIKGFGDVLNEFVERPNGTFRPNYAKTIVDEDALPLATRCSRIDHLTNNVPKGEMEHWVEFYKQVYGFRETRYFDIKGQRTGLQSKVVQSSNNQIIIPINEPDTENGKSQIQEFLDLHKGAGVQHIALMTPDIISTIGELRQREVEFLKTPHTYYQLLPNRLPNVEEDLNTLESLQLLADGDKEGYLLQIFSQTYVGPLFFEYIQRKNHWGFGEGNFQALFDSIELDQKQRGYLD